MARRAYTPEFRTEVLEYLQTHTHNDTARHFEIPRATLSDWASGKSNAGPYPWKVSLIRRGLKLYDEGMSAREVGRTVGVSHYHVLRWVNDPAMREATFEHDPCFQYDINDLDDRLTVAHSLIEPGMGNAERMEIVLAATNYGGSQ